MALTFDDGPSPFTSHLLDVLAARNAKATFFITGANRGRQIDDPLTIYPTILHRMRAEGHQIGSHTWSHENLNQVSAEARQTQMVKNEMAIRNVIGHIPTYMRPPYTACTDACEAQLSTQLGYHLVGWDLDTEDYNNPLPETIHNSEDIFMRTMNQKGGAPILSISHDIIGPTTTELVPFMLQTLDKAGYRAVTVGECLGDDMENWYRGA